MLRAMTMTRKNEQMAGMPQRLLDRRRILVLVLNDERSQASAGGRRRPDSRPCAPTDRSSRPGSRWCRPIPTCRSSARCHHARRTARRRRGSRRTSFRGRFAQWDRCSAYAASSCCRRTSIRAVSTNIQHLPARVVVTAAEPLTSADGPVLTACLTKDPRRPASGGDR
jgi:hypothetical protein